MNVAFVGSREWSDWQKIQKTIEYLDNKFDDLTIISGGSPKGADKMTRWSLLNLEKFQDITYIEYAPKFHDYNQYCAHDSDYYGAEYDVKHYFDRNTEIAETCDVLFAFIPEYMVDDDNQAKGTKDTLKKATDLGKKTKIIS